MAINCGDAVVGGLWPFADSIENLKPTFPWRPWPCPGYDSTFDLACELPTSLFLWFVEIDLGVGAFGGNPYSTPFFGTSFVMEIEIGFKAHIIYDAYFGLNPGTKVTMTMTATELGGAGRVLANTLDIEDQS